MEETINVQKCEDFLHAMGDVPPSTIVALTNCYKNRLYLRCTYTEIIETQLNLLHEICTEIPWWVDLLE